MIVKLVELEVVELVEVVEMDVVEVGVGPSRVGHSGVSRVVGSGVFYNDPIRIAQLFFSKRRP